MSFFLPCEGCNFLFFFAAFSRVITYIKRKCMIDKKYRILCYTNAMGYIHDKTRFTAQLVTWYEENKRILPWRENPLPYYVWVSEIMLQQTRVEAVKPYFERFINTLPSLRDLAVCDDDVLAKLWEGLGYYNRVRNMKKCAIVCVETYDGELPASYEALLELPGIGAYTAGAIASIAFGIKVPAVDGNVLRVFSRVLVSEDDILKEQTKKKFQSIIQGYIPSRPDIFNQALMELGAMICVPNAAPRCNICPVASECLGYQSGQALHLPKKAAKKARRIEKKTILVIIANGKVHLMQRPSEGLLAHLYEFDVLEGHHKKQDIIAQLKTQGSIEKIMPLHPAKHIFTHVEWHMKGYLVEIAAPTIRTGIWADAQEIKETYAIPTAYKAYRDALMAYWEVIT